MRWNLAYRTLLHDRGKLTAGLVGVIFSVVLVNLQGGLFLGLMGKTSTLIDRSDAQIWVGHRGMRNVDFAHPFPERWQYVVAGLKGVDQVEPLRVEFAEMSMPDGNFETVVLVGVQEDSDLGRPYEIVTGPADALQKNDAVVIDDCDQDLLRDPALNELREINGRRIRIAGKSHGVIGFLANPYVFTRYEQLAELTGFDRRDTSYLLVQLKPDADADAVCEAIEARLPDVSAMTASQYAWTSADFWIRRTGIGLSFGAATLLGLLVGLVMVGQTLYAMVLDRVSEYATLRAIGLNERELLSVLIMQSAIVAIVGIAIGFVLTVVLQGALSTPKATIEIPTLLYLGCGILIFVICLVASALPYLRIRRIDPHVVLQG
ncbi:FtsX-like permease family protein [Roseiconus nitratireducens]|uniref:FtsX-like permease family protein n=1 Tax=Roseiconus nitratireducens TaxID=2605748 RepID=A0A5M6DJB0_9BACT|nr:ABC transporter permease [Roseiconus nitratireducens]KAA5546299.1 FtsX-like permease family protein [Roseiconus nitratireducens]